MGLWFLFLQVSFSTIRYISAIHKRLRLRSGGLLKMHACNNTESICASAKRLFYQSHICIRCVLIIRIYFTCSSSARRLLSQVGPSFYLITSWKQDYLLTSCFAGIKEEKDWRLLLAELKLKHSTPHVASSKLFSCHSHCFVFVESDTNYRGQNEEHRTWFSVFTFHSV